MLFTLAALALAAGPSPVCAQLLATAEKDPGFQKQVIASLKARPGVYEKFLGHFHAECAKLTPQDIACAKAHPTLEAIHACPGVGHVFQASLLAPDVTDPAELARYRLRTMQTEARAMLHAIGTAAKSLQVEADDPAKFAFPPAVGPTPPQDCCKQPEQRCAVQAKDWSGATWSALGIQAYDPTRYHYSFVPSGLGNSAGFVARAEGDPMCTGKSEVWELEGKMVNGDLQLGEPKQVK